MGFKIKEHLKCQNQGVNSKTEVGKDEFLT